MIKYNKSIKYDKFVRSPLWKKINKQARSGPARVEKGKHLLTKNILELNFGPKWP